MAKNLTFKEKVVCHLHQSKKYSLIYLGMGYCTISLVISSLRIDDFIDFLKTKVNVVRILAPSFDIAYHIFEILNNRGLPLSNKDLFRNFLISEFHSHGIEDPEERWLELDEYELTSEFISWYVESTTGRSQRYSAFNDLKDIYDDTARFQLQIGRRRIDVFYETIKQSLVIYTKNRQLDFDNKDMRCKIATLQRMRNSTHILNVLLALFNHTENETQQLDFITRLEQYMFRLILYPSIRFSKKVFFESIKDLYNNRFGQASQCFSLSVEEKEQLKHIIKEEAITDNDWAKLLLARYFWGQQVEQQSDVVTIDLVYARATLEHVIPQTIKSKTTEGPMVAR